MRVCTPSSFPSLPRRPARAPTTHLKLSFLLCRLRAVAACCRLTATVTAAPDGAEAEEEAVVAAAAAGAAETDVTAGERTTFVTDCRRGEMEVSGERGATERTAL